MLSNIWKNFNNYTKYGVVPAETKSNNSAVPINSFYKSVHYIDNVVGPVKDMLFGVTSGCGDGYSIGNRVNGLYGRCSTGMVGRVVDLAMNMVLQPLYLVVAYLSYWPAKLVSNKTEGKLISKRNTESLAGYSNMLSRKAEEHSNKVADSINTVLSYAFTAVIWTVASLITPFIWAGEKVASKLGETKAPEKVNDAGAEVGAATATAK